jgi:glycosyltransferase involved in cell wall biosynthesis
MRFLMIPMKYPTAAGESYLTTELADALTAAGHEVEVLHVDWAGAPNSRVEEIRTETGVRVVRCSPKYVSGLGALVRNASKFVLSGRRAAKIADRHFDLSSFDAVVAWMPATAIAPLVRKVADAGIRHRLLFIWDFFPDHHHEIGRIPSGLPLRIARAWEQRNLRHFTSIICTLPGNVDYLRGRFRVSPEQRLLVTPIWGKTELAPPGDRRAIRRRYKLPEDAPIAVFGGQLVEGRGFEQMLGAADVALAVGSSLNFLFVGDGRLAASIRERASSRTNVLYLAALARSDFVELLGACDVGMAATVPGVTSFSIPSKTVDYLRAGLPIIAAVEHGNDFIQILEHCGVGSSVAFGDAELFLSEAERLARGGPIRARAARCLEEIFDVRHAVATVLDAAGAGEAMPRRRAAPSRPKRLHKRSAAHELRRRLSEAG